MNMKPVDIAEMTDAELDRVIAGGGLPTGLTFHRDRTDFVDVGDREATAGVHVSCSGSYGCRIFDTNIPYGD